MRGSDSAGEINERIDRMLFLIIAPVWAAILGIAYSWGADPSGPIMVTGYILAGLTSFFCLLLSADY